MVGDVILSFERWIDCWKKKKISDHTQVGQKITQDNRDSTELRVFTLFIWLNQKVTSCSFNIPSYIT